MTMIGMYHKATGNVAISTEMAFKHVHSKNGWSKPDTSVPQEKIEELAGHLGINTRLYPSDRILDLVIDRSGDYDKAEVLVQLDDSVARQTAPPAALSDDQGEEKLDSDADVENVNIEVNADQANLEFPNAEGEQPKASKSKNKNA